jgi:hypothetical protein
MQRKHNILTRRFPSPLADHVKIMLADLADAAAFCRIAAISTHSPQHSPHSKSIQKYGAR